MDIRLTCPSPHYCIRNMPKTTCAGNIRLLRNLIHQWPEARAESGLPLRPLALWRLMVQAAPEEKAVHLDQLAKGLVYQPSALSLYLFDQAKHLVERSELPDTGKVVRSLERWRHLWDLHEAARRLHQDLFQKDIAMVSPKLENPTRFVWRLGLEDEVLIAAQSEASLRDNLRRLLDPKSTSALDHALPKLPPYMGARISVNGQALIGAGLTNTPLLATAESRPLITRGELDESAEEVSI